MAGALNYCRKSAIQMVIIIIFIISSMCILLVVPMLRELFNTYWLSLRMSETVKFTTYVTVGLLSLKFCIKPA